MTIWCPTDNGYADLSSHDSFVAGPPHNTFRRLRDEHPLSWSDYPHGLGFWNVVRHADIIDMNKNYRLLSSARGIRMEDQTQEEYLARRTFQELDPPEHTRTRLRVARAFAKPVIAKFAAQIHDLCDEIVERALNEVEIDAVAVVARQLPMRMLGRILALPETDLDWLVRKGDELIANTDPEYTAHVLDRDNTDAYRLLPFRSPAGAELYDYAKEVMTEKRKSGADTGVLGLLFDDDDDSKDSSFSDAEFRNFFCLLVAAGNDTTRYTIAAAMQALAEKPHLHDQLRQADDGLWSTAADEFIRWASPTMYFRRTATDDFEMYGKQVKARDKLLLWFVSGNRDERAFDAPFEIDLRRPINKHVAFGPGPHMCLGMWLARLEVKVLLQTIAARVARIEQTGPHEYLRANFVGGIKRLPVRLTAR